MCRDKDEGKHICLPASEGEEMFDIGLNLLSAVVSKRPPAQSLPHVGNVQKLSLELRRDSVEAYELLLNADGAKLRRSADCHLLQSRC